MIHKHHRFRRLLSGILAACLVFSQPLSAKADPKEDRIAQHQAMPVQTNEIEGWPQGPVVSAESAILMEADSGTILYAKNIHKQQYPASTTKILTALLAYENSSMSDIVTFSHDDVFGIPRNSNHIAMDVGDTLTMEQCMNALLIRSANEVAYAMAAHVGGSWDAFAEMMNQRAKELGAVDSHFVNPNGLPDEEHVTSAYDLALIGRAFFANETLCKITLTAKLVIPKEKEDLIEWNQMGLIPTGKYAYEYLVGCKTGYTDTAHNALVSCAEKNGMRLICVVLNDENPKHYEDTIALFEYGFHNFDKVNISQTETKYDIDNIGFFYNDTDIFGTGGPILSLNREDCVILPKSAGFGDLVSLISYETENPGQAAMITYTYHGTPVGQASLDLVNHSQKNFSFDSDEGSVEAEHSQSPAPAAKPTKEPNEKKTPSFVFISPLVIRILLGILAGGGVLFGIVWILQKNFQFSFGPGLRRSRSRTAYQRDLQNARDLRRERKLQIRAAKKRYKNRYKRK